MIKISIFAISLLSVILLAGVTSVSNFDNNLQNNSIEKSEYATTFVQFASAALHTVEDKEATLGYVGGTVLHDNDSITQNVGEGVSTDFTFPAHGTDHLFLLDIGVDYHNGTISESSQNDFDNTVAINFVTDTLHGLQVSTATYNDGSVEIVQTATTIPGTNYVVYNIEATNISGGTINAFSIGVYTDWDIGGTIAPEFSDDFGEYDVGSDTMITSDSVFAGLSGLPASSGHHLGTFASPDTSVADIFPPNGGNGQTGPQDVTVGLVWDNPVTFLDGDTFTVKAILAMAGTEDALLTQIAIAKDTTPPDVTITATTATDPTNDNPISFTATFTEEVTGLDEGELTITNGSVDGGSLMSGDGIVYTFDVTPTADGQVDVDIAAGAAKDTAGNDNTIAATFSIESDQTKPVISLTVFGSETTPVRLDIDSAAYVEPGATVADNFGADPSAAVTGDIVDNEATGIYTILYDAEDFAGNVADQVTRIVTVSDISIDDVEINGTPEVSPEALWVEDDVAASGSVEGALPGDTVTIVWDDGTPDTTGVPIGTIVAGVADWGPSSVHNYAMTESDGTVGITAILVGSEVATSDAVSVDIIKHPTSTSLSVGATNTKWDNNFGGTTATVMDTATSTGIDGALVKFGGIGVAGEGDQTATTGVSGTTPAKTLQAGKAVDVGAGKQVTATYDENQFYLDSGDTTGTITLDPHTVTLLTTHDANVLWDGTLLNVVTNISDDDEVLAGLVNSDTGSELTADGITFTYGDLGVAGEEDPLQNKVAGPLADTGSDSEASTAVVTLQAGKAIDVGLQNIETHFDGTVDGIAAYVPNTVGSAVTLDPHTTSTNTIIVEDEVLWDHPFTAETIIIDTQAELAGLVNSDTGSELPALEIIFTYSGLGVALEDIQSHTTGPLADDSLVSTATTGVITLQGGAAADADGTGKDVVATFAGTVHYLGSADSTDSIVLAPHNTFPTLDTLTDIVAGTAFTPSGLVTDSDRILFDDSANVAALGGAYDPLGITSNFVSFDTGSFAGETIQLSGSGIGSTINPIIRGITITDPNASFANNGVVDVVKLKVGGTITFTTESSTVTLDIRNLGFDEIGDGFPDTATFSVSTNDSPDFDFVAVGIDLTTDPSAEQFVPNFAQPLISQSSGITQITLTSLDIESGDDFIEISGISISDPNGEPQVIFSVSIDDVPANERVLDKKDSVTFIDGAYHDIVSTAIEVDTNLEVKAEFLQSEAYNQSGPVSDTFDIIFSSWGVGGTNFSIVPDAGTGFTSVSCGTADIDSDSICNAWDFHKKIAYASASGNLVFDIPAGDNRFGGTLIAPSLQKRDVYVEIDYMADHKPDELALRDVITEFFNSNSIAPGATGINLNIFVDESITEVAEFNVWSDNDNDLTNDFQSVKSRHFGYASERSTLTGAQSSNINGNTIEITGLSYTKPSSAPHDQGTITIQERIVVSGAAPTLDSITWTPASGVDINLDFRLFTGSAAKSITQESPGVYIIQTDITYRGYQGGTFDIGTIKFNLSKEADSSSLYKNSPIIFSNLIKAKAYIYHYFLWVHSIGECGPSGVAETDGNDGIVALGCDFEGVHAGAAIDGNGNDRSIGDRSEQAGTFAHELGHQLGLLHGGPRVDAGGVEIADSSINCKPNYNSVMSYSRQIPGPSIGLLTLGQFSAAYSNGNLPNLDETSLNEQIGIDTSEDTTIVYGAPGTVAPIRKAAVYDSGAGDPTVKINWDGDGTFDPSNVIADINNLGFGGCEESPNQSYSDHDDWNLLNFNFRGATGQAFDGVHGDPKKIADYTPVIKEQVESTGLFYTGTFDPIPKDGTGTFKLGSTVPFKFSLYTCNPFLDTASVVCVDEAGLFNGAESLTCTPGAVGCNEVVLEVLPDELIFLQVTKTSDSEAFGSDVTDISDLEGSTGFFVWNEEKQQYHFNWDTKDLLENKGKGKKKGSGVGGEYSLLAIILNEGVPSLLVDLDNRFYLPSDLDRVDPIGPGIANVDPDAGYPVTMQVTLVG